MPMVHDDKYSKYTHTITVECVLNSPDRYRKIIIGIEGGDEMKVDKIIFDVGDYDTIMRQEGGGICWILWKCRNEQFN